MLYLFLCLLQTHNVHLVDITMFYAAEGGGVSSYLNAKARWLARRGNIFHTIVSSSKLPAGGPRGVVATPGLMIPGLPAFRLPWSVESMASALTRLQPDLIEAGDACHSAWAALRLKRRQNVPVVAFYHSDMPRVIGRRFGALAQRTSEKYLCHLYRQYDMVLAPSMAMVQRLADMGIEEARHQPLGVDTWTFCPYRRDPTFREQLCLPPDARLLVFAGRFAPEKNLHLLLQAVRRLGKPYHLVLIGSGEALPRSRQTTFIPFVRDVRLLAQLLASCDALVHPGDSETFGLVVLEAMACGLPVIGAHAGGVAELVDAQTGLLVAPGSVSALCEGIEAVFAAGPAQLGANARNKAVHTFDWDRIVPQLLRRYGSLLSSGQRAEMEARIAYAAGRR